MNAHTNHQTSTPTGPDRPSRSALSSRSAPPPTLSALPATRRRRRVGLVEVMAIVAMMLIGPAAGTAVADPALGPVPDGVWAQELVVAQAESVDEVLTNVRNWIMGIAAGLATVFFSVGAVRYMAAGGDLGELEKAKIAFRSAAFGYALALLTPLVLSVLREIVGAG